MELFKGRINRATYFAGLAILVALVVLLRIFIFVRSGPSVEVVFIFLAVPRLHDIGRSGWWVLAGAGLEIAGMAIAVVSLPPEDLILGAGAVMLVIYGLMVWLGSLRGEPGPNRFGDPPAPGLPFKRKAPSS